MALQDLLDLSTKRKKIGISPERIEAIKPQIRQYIAFWREYPDLFVDFMLEQGNPQNFHFYFYQRIFLRVAMRYKYVYGVFPRAYSKSFLSVMILMCRCILYPRSKLFITSGGKEQAAGIARDKVNEICSLIPAFENELDRRPGRTRESKDTVIYMFRGGSMLTNVAASERSRGKRFHGGLIEECVGVDGDILSTVILPTMNVSRLAMDGTRHDDETLNKSQIFVTTAGWKGTFSYDKLIQFLVWMVTEPDKAFVMGGTWRIPVLTGLQSKNFIQDLKNDGSFNDAAFSREYESEWSGSSEDAFFRAEAFDRNRELQKPEYEYSKRSNSQSYYIISVDVGRKDCDSVATVFKIIPQVMGDSISSLVNIYTFSDEHFKYQAIKLKQLYYKYKARRLIIDGNGLGIGLIDEMVMSQEDPITGDIYPDFGIYNDNDGSYHKYKTKKTEQEAIYIIKANAPINSDAHSNVQARLNAGKIKFLIDEKEAKNKLLGTKVGQNMTPEERAEYLRPFTLTSILKEEMLNLREENEGLNINLKQANKKIRKDKFSALEYGLYYVKHEEENKRRKRFNAKDWMFMN